MLVCDDRRTMIGIPVMWWMRGGIDGRDITVFVPIKIFTSRVRVV